MEAARGGGRAGSGPARPRGRPRVVASVPAMRAMQSRSRTAAGLALAVALVRVGPGCGESSFVCEGDESCAGLPGGQCEANGYCSAPDPDCPAGRRYAAHAGALSGHCVGDEATGPGTTATSATDDASTSIDGGETSPSSGSDSTGSDPTGEPTLDPCEGQLPVVSEPFTALPIDVRWWSVFNDAGMAVNVLGDELRLSAIEADGAYADLGTAFPLPSSGSGGVDLSIAPPVDAMAEAYLELSALDSAYGFRVSGGDVVIFRVDAFSSSPLAMMPYDPQAHRWLRLVFDAPTELVAWETAPALGQWERLYEAELDAGFDVEESRIAFGAGVWSGPLTAEPLAAFGHAFVCSTAR